MTVQPSPVEATTPVSKSVHDTFLKNSVPDWLKKATPQQLDALKTAPDALPDWYQHASAAQRQSLMDCIAASFTAQSTLDNAMSQLQDIDTFARPLLIKALKDQFKVELDVDKTYICLRKSVTMGVFNVTAGSFEALKLPLLQAALHNFEAAECEAGAFHASSGFVVQAATG
ncbi:dermonecrotic toxin domain-containing protein, partial [Pseudomonas sp. NFPP04]